MKSTGRTARLAPVDWAFLVQRSDRCMTHLAGRIGPGPALRRVLDVLRGVAASRETAALFWPVEGEPPQCVWPKGVRCSASALALSAEQHAYALELGEGNLARGISRAVENIRWLI